MSNLLEIFLYYFLDRGRGASAGWKAFGKATAPQNSAFVRWEFQMIDVRDMRWQIMSTSCFPLLPPRKRHVDACIKLDWAAMHDSFY